MLRAAVFIIEGFGGFSQEGRRRRGQEERRGGEGRRRRGGGEKKEKGVSFRREHSTDVDRRLGPLEGKKK